MMDRLFGVELFDISATDCRNTGGSTRSKVCSQKAGNLVAGERITHRWVDLQAVGPQIFFSGRVFDNPAFVQTQAIQSPDALNCVEATVGCMYLKVRRLGKLIRVAGDNIPW